MLSGRLVWAGDHFTPIELAQLRRDRERKARAWLHESMGYSRPSLFLLVVPERSIEAGVLLDPALEDIEPLDPLFPGARTSGSDIEGRHFTTMTPRARVRIFYNGIIEAISSLRPSMIADEWVNPGMMEAPLAAAVKIYREVQSKLGLGERAWLALTLLDTVGLGAARRPSELKGEKLSTARLAVPEFLLDDSTDPAAADNAARRIVNIIHSGFGL